MIELRNICKQYGNLEVLKNVNAEINDGDIVAVIGSSGSGKSTLLNCINLLDRPTSGHVIFKGIDLMDPDCDVKKQRNRIGMVFQQFNLFGHMTVLENAMNPQVDLLGMGRQEACDNAMKYLRLVGMADRIWDYSHELSGGQKQRAAIARMLAMEPEVILMDEPTSNLDPTMVGEVEYVIRKLAEQGRTMVIVTHDMELVRQVSTRVFYMDEQGIYEEGPTEKILNSPEKEKTRRFIKNHKCLDIKISSKDFDYISTIEAIKDFCNRRAFDNKRSTSVQLLFEELCIVSLLPYLKEDEEIEVSFEYDKLSDKLAMRVKHYGELIFDKLRDEASIAGILIDSLSEQIEISESIAEKVITEQEM